MARYDHILDTIGNTPVVKLHRIPPKHVTIYVKIEAFNPLSSVKDRLALAIIDDERLDDYWLVVAATDDRAINARIAADANAARRLCNVVDDPALCSFVMPAIVDRAPVTIAIGSSGLSPVLTRWIKGLLETLLPERLGTLAALAGRWRERVRVAIPDPDERRRFWERVVSGDVATHAFASAVLQ